ncbi:hypothetical protein CTAYLR_000192 [Chrysophaeum taylorii]|uniref:GST N-terminal domain-containing protein n=1 Tax=Chrysophaeum taylorii TaxID=2483200 RepID=A0AAD7XPM0_9STRA|nr:hypothetical protein CTAYLR_000192 [Chrysophaeum taylorii]
MVLLVALLTADAFSRALADPQRSTLGFSAISASSRTSCRTSARAASPEEEMPPVLYCKPSRDGEGVGDCPFTHYARMAMEVSNQAYQLKPTPKADKPQWLLDDHGGSMPCLAPVADGTGAVSESAKIAAVALPPTPEDEKSMSETSTLFGSIAKFIKNTDPSADEELAQGVYAALEKVESRLEVLGTPYLSGKEDPGLSDCSIATKLYVLTVAAPHFKDSFEIPIAKFPRLDEYAKRVFACDAFLKTKYPEDEMIFGWSQARSGGH